ncbi:MAG: Asp-tRNA(Asn)/Glu-tRNA(Gln) amidotransferase subunit GatA [Candidatus Paceibacterota bacterium]
MTIDIKNLTIRKAHASLLAGEYTCVDLAQAYLDNIKKFDPGIHAYLEVYNDVLVQAKKADERIKNKDNVTLLTGIPISIKDNILIKDRIVSSASKMLENYHGTYDATVIKKLKEAGVVFLGRTNMDEFAMGGSTENSAFGPTHNPHDLSRVPGGSSGGAVASVAGDMALVALGSDTGGSIREPASFCGLVGLKPTYGAVSRHGLMAMGSSFDQIGPITKNIDDAKIVFDFIAGQDSLDSTTITKPELITEKKSFKIGVPKQVTEVQGINLEVLRVFTESIEKFKKLGYEIREISLPNINYSLAVYYTLIPAEVSSNLARFDGMRYGLHTDGANMVDDYFKTRQVGFGQEVIRRIILGTYILSSGYYDAYYNKANIVRDLIRDDFKKAFQEVDLILTPTAPSPAFKIGEKISDPLTLYLEDIFTVPANLVGVPAISLPAGSTEIDGKKLPLGIQLMSAHSNEAILFQAGSDFENQ